MVVADSNRIANAGKTVTSQRKHEAETIGTHIRTTADVESDDDDDDIGEFESAGLKKMLLNGSSTPVLVRQHNWLLRFLLRAKVNPVPKERPRLVKSFRKNPLSIFTWGWVGPILRTGYSRILEIKDIYQIPEEEMNEVRVREFHYKMAQLKTVHKRTKFAEFYAIFYAVRYWFLANLFTACLFVAASLGMSLISRVMIEEIDKIYMGETTNHGKGIGYAIGTVVIQLCFQCAFVWNGFKTRYQAEVVRTLMMTVVYDKIMRLSPEGRQRYPAGKITSLVTTDTQRIFMAARWAPMLLVFGPAFGGSLAVLVCTLGVSGLPGCGLVLAGVILNLFLSRLITMLRQKSLPFADRRISLIRETMEHMRVIKYYGWERSFVEIISAARRSESGFLKLLGVVEGAVDSFLTSIPDFGGVLSFAVRIIIAHKLTPAEAFPSLTLFQMFVPFSMMFSEGLKTHADAYVSVKRLEEFFKAPEEPTYVACSDIIGAIQVSDGCFDWAVDETLDTKQKTGTGFLSSLRKKKAEGAEETFPLNSLTEEKNDIRAGARKFPGLIRINLDIRPGELIYVVGSIGSGKSTLLNCMLGNVPRVSGSVTVGGRTSAVLTTWCQSATIRENILFGKPYDRIRYRQTIFACCLEPDLEQIVGRDLAEVGERGITLSGGQKARIALARCVYAGGDVIILDDVLSAVDGKVANHIMRHCVNGLISKTTRVIATHNLRLISEKDRVIYMDGRGGFAVGVASQLAAQEPKFKNLMEMSKMEGDGRSISDKSELAVTEQLLDEEVQAINSRFDDAEILENIDRTSASLVDVSSVVTTTNDGDQRIVRLMKQEKRAAGRVPWAVVLDYVKSGSSWGLMILPVIVIFQASFATDMVMQSIFLQFWTADTYDQSNGFYIGIYCLLIVLLAVFFVLLVACISIFCFNSSSELHNGALSRLYKAPMSYFDTTPLGRIINRFTDDVSNLDTQMFMLLTMAITSVGSLLATMITVFVYVPWSILAVIPSIGISLTLYNYYRTSSIELKRINSLFRSSLFTLVSESISGLSVILGYGRQGEFKELLNERIDDMNVSFQVNLASQYWLSLRISSAMLLVTLVVVLLSVFQYFHLDTAKVGMLLSLLPSLSFNAVILLPNLVDLENQFNSVERLYELKYKIPQEAPDHIPEHTPVANWPLHGSIEFVNVTMSYRPGLPHVLKGVSFRIKGGERVGICGRTGAGKSTLLSALFRLSEVSSGNIYIDGLDIGLIGLQDLRSKLAIIPQEPILFQGTVRSNLDPFDECDDTTLWGALGRAGVIRKADFVGDGTSRRVHPEHKFHLDAKVDSNGENFSLGERQLLALARALVRDSKVLVLDEATAAVDVETDQLIQDTVASEFSSSTILCIAHRLQTISKYDKVIVMESGQVSEMGAPLELFLDKSSSFSAMCAEYGLVEADF